MYLNIYHVVSLLNNTNYSSKIVSWVETAELKLMFSGSLCPSWGAMDDATSGCHPKKLNCATWSGVPSCNGTSHSWDESHDHTPSDDHCLKP